MAALDGLESLPHLKKLVDKSSVARGLLNLNGLAGAASIPGPGSNP